APHLFGSNIQFRQGYKSFPFDREYITSVRSTYLRPCVTAAPPCRRSCRKISAIPVSGLTLRSSVLSFRKKSVVPPVHSSLRYTMKVSWLSSCSFRRKEPS